MSEIKVTEFTYHDEPLSCINRIWDRNEKFFDLIQKIEELCGVDMDNQILDRIDDFAIELESLVYGNQPDICDIRHFIVKEKGLDK